MLRRAVDQAGGGRRVIGVSRFGSGGLRQSLEDAGVDTLSCDLLDPAQLDALPDAPNIVYMAGMKFGSTGPEALTWAMNSYLPGMVCRRFRSSRIVAFSTGNVYGLTDVPRGGSVETDPPNPQGEYAMSCLGRERIFEHFSRALQVPVSLIRLNYATELRYGVLVDLARRVAAGEEIDLSVGYVNVIWQADANAMSIRAFEHAASPPFVLNVAGPEVLSVRDVCEQMARQLGQAARFKGVECPDALLSNAALSHRLFGPPRVRAAELIRWTADWVSRGGPLLDKPTHFESRDGKF
jgi:nucleoside-diphosphate-sugar epimerase